MATLGSIAVKLGLDPSQFRNGLISARSSLAAFKASINDSDSRVGRFAKTLEKIGSSAKEKITEIARLGVQIGAVASTALTATPAVLKAGQAVYQFGAAAVAAAPMLLAFGAAGLVIKTTFAQIGPAIGKSLDPITLSLNKAGERASVLATKGIPQLAQGFAKANFPAISWGMNSIAVSTNRVIERFLTWGKSVYGVTAIRNLMTGTAKAVETLGPHISRLVGAFGNMIGRIAEVSLSAGANGLSGVIEKLVSWMNRVNAVSVMTGLRTLRADLQAVWNSIQRVVEVTKTAITFWHEHRAAIMAVQDALSILAIAFGGPAIAVVAAVGLIIRHWDQLKTAYAVLKSWLAGPINVGFMDTLRTAAETILPPLQNAWNGIKAAVGPVLTEIWNRIQTQVIPALSAFIAAVAPIVAMLVNVLGPVVAQVFASIGNIISGAISVITGIIQVFTAILTGDWRGAWEGVKNIVAGVLQIIGGIISGALAAFAGAIGTGLAGIGTIFRGLAGIVFGALGNLPGTFATIGWDIIRGIGNGLQAGWSWLTGLVSNIARSLFNAAKSALGIASPSKVFAGIGGNVGAGLAQGLLGSRKLVGNAMSSLTGTLAVPGQALRTGLPSLPAVAGLSGTAAGPKFPPIELKSDGSRLGDLLVEVLRKSIRGLGGDVQGALGS